MPLNGPRLVKIAMIALVLLTGLGFIVFYDSTPRVLRFIGVPMVLVLGFITLIVCKLWR